MSTEILDGETLRAERLLLVKNLSKLAKSRQRAEERARELREEADILIIEGASLGVPRSTLASAAGLTRQTVYMILARAGL